MKEKILGILLWIIAIVIFLMLASGKLFDDNCLGMALFSEIFAFLCLVLTGLLLSNFHYEYHDGWFGPLVCTMSIIANCFIARSVRNNFNYDFYLDVKEFFLTYPGVVVRVNLFFILVALTICFVFFCYQECRQKKWFLAYYSIGVVVFLLFEGVGFFSSDNISSICFWASKITASLTCSVCFVYNFLTRNS